MDLIRHGQAAGIPALAGPGTAAVAAGHRDGAEGRGGRVVLSHPGRCPAAGAAQVRPDLDEVFRRDYRVVVSVAAGVLGDRDQAQDVAQEVFLSFSRSAVPAARTRGWLCVAAAHTALNTIRSHRRRAGREEAAATVENTVVPDVAEAVVARDEHRQVRAALARLPRTQAVALLLRHSGLSYADVAAALDMSPTSIGTTVRRAEAALRKELNRHGSHI
ncbi:RNA polymerase sigma-70 factor, ECF subfamily [Frankia sp. EI5c]|uniref:sigma-70 family RNA polymerase sigma factor n=1 Tax=Frankia sp. EI5c TaxID=683316 RepID=UPI0007C288B5|nr:sigma-70 family RNA polymerase sigma factor [Frankia sp. EI5c]OAA18324.1 RNA polymerase sigma-70 factor, ECF subfamily [Frankia sp. EI5c]